jgi:hypothetical protein
LGLVHGIVDGAVSVVSGLGLAVSSWLLAQASCWARNAALDGMMVRVLEVDGAGDELIAYSNLKVG